MSARPRDIIGRQTSDASRVWDVVIVGAGPAGSTAAIHLAARGHSVLLLDKEVFPRDKVCGDGLIADAIRALRRAGLYEEVRPLSREAKVGSVFSPSRIEFDVPGEYLTIKRLLLDDLIVRKAIARGARLRHVKITNVEAQADGTVVLSSAREDELIHARIAFIATGANVELATKLGLVTQPGPSAVALRCYVRSSFALDRLVISYDRSITPGYAWIFPLRDGEYNVGCGIRYREKNGRRASLRESFHEFITRFPLAADLLKQADSVSELRGAMLRCELAGTNPLGPGNILVLGESVGATFPFTGEGIGKAMETGEIAAEVAREALETGDFDLLSEYPKRLERELKPKYRGYIFAEDWLSRPWLNDFVARRVRRSRFLQKAVTGIVNETVDPREVFSLRGILRSFVR